MKSNKKTIIVLFCIAGFLIFAVCMFRTFVIRDYKGRKTTGKYEIAQASAILIDEKRLETFEQDGSNREVPIHFYFPRVTFVTIVFARLQILFYSI